MICTNEQLNTDFDDKQTDVNWEDHTGLCYLAANILCSRTPPLLPYKDDIVDDLKAKLWQCSLPQEDGKGYDPSKGRFSTYAMTAMLRCRRDIKVRYLDVREWRDNDTAYKSLNDDGRGEWRPLTYYIEGEQGEDWAKKEDLAVIRDFVADGLDRKTRQFFLALYGSHRTQIDTASMFGISRGSTHAYMKRIRAEARRVRRNFPEIADQFDAVFEELAS